MPSFLAVVEWLFFHSVAVLLSACLPCSRGHSSREKWGSCFAFLSCSFLPAFLSWTPVIPPDSGTRQSRKNWGAQSHWCLSWITTELRCRSSVSSLFVLVYCFEIVVHLFESCLTKIKQPVWRLGCLVSSTRSLESFWMTQNTFLPFTPFAAPNLMVLYTQQTEGLSPSQNDCSGLLPHLKGLCEIVCEIEILLVWSAL